MKSALQLAMEPMYKYLRFLFEDVFAHQGDFALGLSKVTGQTRGAAAGNAAAEEKVNQLMLTLFKDYSFFLTQMKQGGLAEHLLDNGFVEQTTYTQLMENVLRVHDNSCAAVRAFRLIPDRVLSEQRFENYGGVTKQAALDYLQCMTMGVHGG